MVQFKKQLRRCRRAVSDIIGNLLILAITVTLFSSVMYYVVNMPSPEEQTYAEMSYSISDLSGGARWVNVTHQGGQVLYESNTNIYLFKYSTQVISLKISNSTNPLGDEWITGETWSYLVTGINEDTPLDMLIIDVAHNSNVWESQLIGGTTAGSYAPIITTRGTTPAVISSGSTFKFYASVMDPNGDLNRSSVYVDASSIGLGQIQLLDPDNDGVFVSASQDGDIAFNEKVVMMNAKDYSGKNSSSRFTLTVQSGGSSTTDVDYGPYYNYSSYLVNGTYPPDASGGESGGSTGTTFYYIKDLNGTITRNFKPGQAFYIEIYSDGLTNLALENSFTMTNPSTGALMTPQTKLVNAFSYGGIYSTFHRYIINLTAPSLPLAFPLQISLRDNAGTRVNIADTITVAGANYPILKTYKLNSAGTLDPCTTFNHTDVVYLKIITKDVDSTITSVVVSDLQVNDYSGKYVVKQTLPTPSTYTSTTQPALNWNMPLSQVYKTSTASSSPDRVKDNVISNSAYTIQINLLQPNSDWWLSGKNMYTLLIPLFTDSGNSGTGETYYNTNIQINVTAPISTTDLVTSIGSGSFTWSASGAVWENNKLVWYQNGERADQWDATMIDSDTYNGPIGMAIADIDNDGYQDVVVGFQDQSISIAWYRNIKSDGSAWSTYPYTICTSFDALSGTQSVGDSTDKGSAYSEDSSVWRTAGGTDRFASGYYAVNEIVGAIKPGDFDGDGDIDIVASFIHAVVYTSATGTSDADYTNSYGMFFNRGIYVFWNDGNWTKTQLYSTNSYTNKDDNPAAMDLAVGDLNQDGVDDIVAVYETGVTNIWINQWKQVIGISSNPKSAAFGSGSLVPAANVPTVTPNTNPWDHTQRTPSVAIADVDLNGYPDIIRTCTGISTGSTSRTVTVIRTISSTSTDILKSPSAEYNTTEPITASVIGTMANLVADDGSYETLKEVYKNTTVMYGLPDQKQTVAPNPDDTGQVLNNLKYYDGSTYNVDSYKTMNIKSFLMDSTYSTKLVTQAILSVRYAASATYNGNSYIQYSLDGSTWVNTTMLPTSSSLNVNQTYNLYLKGIDTWGELQSLRVRFYNSGSVGTVQFDYVRLEATFDQTRWMERIYQIPNVSTQMTHTLGMSAYTTGETFNVSYSTDGTIWYSAFVINSTTEKMLTTQLPYTTNSVYFIKVLDTNRLTSDVTNDSLVIDYLGIHHVSPTVSWPDGYKLTVSFTMQSSSEWITCLAVGDVGSSSGTHIPDDLPDIMVGTSYVGSASSTQTLMLSYGGGNFYSAPIGISTSTLSAAVGSNNGIYNTQTIALGDFNGDGYTDMALIIGFAPGRSGGTAPSIWIYRNDPTVGQWGEQVLNALASGESAINVQAGNVDISILYPILGVLGLVAVEGAISRVDRKRKK